MNPAISMPCAAPEGLAVGFSLQKKLLHKSSHFRTSQVPRLALFLIMILKTSLKMTNPSPTNPLPVPLRNRTYLFPISLLLTPYKPSAWHAIQLSLSFPSPPPFFLSPLSPSSPNQDRPHLPSLSSLGRNNSTNLRIKAASPRPMLSRCITFPILMPTLGIITLISAPTFTPQTVSAPRAQLCKGGPRT